ncbi:MAG: 1,4-alpha-glucan branching protein GlgB [Pseudomonadota bacterium]
MTGTAAEVWQALQQQRCDQPYAALGWQRHGKQWCYRTWLPDADTVIGLLGEQGAPLTFQRIADGVFESAPHARRCGLTLQVGGRHGSYQRIDPWQFAPPAGVAPTVSNRYRELGAQVQSRSRFGVRARGVRFTLWAPAAQAVQLIGDFCHWQDGQLPMQRLADGYWWLFVPDAEPGQLYKFLITDCHGTRREKSDPQARAMELAPGNASRIVTGGAFRWRDAGWRRRRARTDVAAEPMSIYELHAGSWRRHPDGRWYSYRELADALVPYLVALGYSHVEFMPLAEHPFTGSWGYQVVGLFAPTARFGTPDELKYLIDRCHRAGIAVLLDWVPAHFPRDEHGLIRFDGSALYEHPDPRRGEHPDWGTLIYDYGKAEVCDFLISNALYWLKEFHFDGLRIDAVASMLYLDYSRGPGQWLPNARGGNEHDEAIAFFRRLHAVLRAECPEAITIAEESTAWPGVTRPVEQGGLGFDFKWNMGWMHDSLRYLGKEPIHRRYHHDDIRFGLSYAFSERFVLALSHDEVVHGKASLLNKCPGDAWQQFATLRAFYGLQFAHPGKKLLFMGGEFGQHREWNHDAELEWPLLQQTLHNGVQGWVRALNQSYRQIPALWQRDTDPHGFEWLEADADAISVYAFVRWDNDGRAPLIALMNFTPVVRHGYRLGVPAVHETRAWREILNSDANAYGGSGITNDVPLQVQGVPAHGRAQSIVLELPPLATIWLQPEAMAHEPTGIAAETGVV